MIVLDRLTRPVDRIPHHLIQTEEEPGLREGAQLHYPPHSRLFTGHDVGMTRVPNTICQCYGIDREH